MVDAWFHSHPTHHTLLEPSVCKAAARPAVRTLSRIKHSMAALPWNLLSRGQLSWDLQDMLSVWANTTGIHVQ
jgi:hypothetical protein